MTSLLLLTLIITAIPFSVYLIYILAAITSKPIPPKPLESLPNISIVIPAYNEESVIKDRISNLADVFPKDRMEIIIYNDGSSDSTDEIAKNPLNNHFLTGKVFTHAQSGVNKTINFGINESFNEIVVITGTDGLFDKDNIPYLVSVLLLKEKSKHIYSSFIVT